MRVGLNATCFNDRPSGAKQRFVGLYGTLMRACPEVEFIIYEPSDCRVANWFGDLPNVTAVRTPLPSTGRVRRSVGSFSYWRQRVARDRLDLFEVFNLPLPSGLDVPTILTTHDVRSTRSKALRHLSRHLHRRAFRAADVVITVSDTMREEILQLAPDARVVTIHNGVDPAAFASSAPAAINHLHGHLLAVGHFEPRKNYPRLIAAFARLHADRSGLRLVIVGRDSGDLAEVRAAVARFGLGEAVVLHHDLDDTGLSALYRSAALVVAASTYEGFGIPLIETMAAGRPLATSDIAVFAELTEGQGAMFDPSSVADLAATIAAILDSPNEQRRLIDYGRTRVRDFAFDRLARHLAEVQRDVVAAAGTDRLAAQQ